MRGLWIAAFLVLIMTGCIPSTRANIEMGNGYDMVAMRRAEETMIANGFTPNYYYSNSGEKQERFSFGDKLISGFEGPLAGSGAAVVLRNTDGRLYVQFGERNTSFSTEGRQVLNKLVIALRSEFGEKVAVNE